MEIENRAIFKEFVVKLFMEISGAASLLLLLIQAILMEWVILFLYLKVVNHPTNYGGLQQLKLNYNF